MTKLKRGSQKVHRRKDTSKGGYKRNQKTKKQKNNFKKRMMPNVIKRTTKQKKQLNL